MMASVRLSYGEDLQIDWDGRGRLLVKVGPLPPPISLQPGLTKRPCALGRVALCVGEEFLSPQAPSPLPEEQASLVYGSLVFAVWTPLVHLGDYPVWGFDTPRASREGGLLRG